MVNTAIACPYRILRRFISCILSYGFDDTRFLRTSVLPTIFTAYSSAFASRTLNDSLDVVIPMGSCLGLGRALVGSNPHRSSRVSTNYTFILIRFSSSGSKYCNFILVRVWSSPGLCQSSRRFKSCSYLLIDSSLVTHIFSGSFIGFRCIIILVRCLASCTLHIAVHRSRVQVYFMPAYPSECASSYLSMLHLRLYRSGASSIPASMA